MLSPLQGFTLQFWDCVRRMIPKTVSVKWAWVTELSLWFALSPDSSLVPWEKALLSLGRSSTHMHQTAVDFTALFRLLQPKKKFTHGPWLIFTCSLISSPKCGNSFSVWFSLQPYCPEEISIVIPIGHGQCNLAVPEGNGTRGRSGFSLLLN